ncbi:MAG: hypothetical protein Q9217_003607 [Psora testacea]
MSLHRVSSTTSYEHVRNSSPARSEHTKMSFNPAGSKLMPPETKEEPIGASKVPKAKRILQVSIAVIYCLFSAGVVFGYAALKPVLVKEGVYRELCDEKEEIIEMERGGSGTCYEQEIRLNLMFTTAAVVTNVCALPVGTILDKYGPRISGIIGCILLAVGSLLMANTFTPQKFFLVYLIVPISILIVQGLIMPGNSYRTVGEIMAQAETAESSPRFSNGGNDARSRQGRYERRESAIDEMTSLLGKGVNKQQQQEEKRKRTSGVWGAQHGRSAYQQIRTPWFVLIALFTVVQMTRINYFVATIRTQYEYLLGSDTLAEKVNHVFDVALPVGGILSIPFIGLVLDNTSTPFCLGLLVTTATTIGILGVLPYAWSAYANITLFVLYRPLYYTAVSDYAAKVFGFHTFGKVYGLIICLAGLLNFSQSALDAATHKAFHGNPVPVNLILLSFALVVGVLLVGYVWHKSRTMHREQLEVEAEEAPDVIMPGAATEAE